MADVLVAVAPLTISIIIIVIAIWVMLKINQRAIYGSKGGVKLGAVQAQMASSRTLSYDIQVVQTSDRTAPVRVMLSRTTRSDCIIDSPNDATALGRLLTEAQARLVTNRNSQRTKIGGFSGHDAFAFKHYTVYLTGDAELPIKVKFSHHVVLGGRWGSFRLTQDNAKRLCELLETATMTAASRTEQN